MANASSSTRIQSSDFEAFVSDVAAAIWNQLMKNPAFKTLELRDYPSVFEAVARTLSVYQTQPRSRNEERS